MAAVVCFSRIVSLFKSHPGLGLIRSKLVIRAFIHKHSRFVVGIQVDPKNRAATIFDLFVHTNTKHGTPYHIPAAHRIELVTGCMEDIRSPVSYIWGR